MSDLLPNILSRVASVLRDAEASFALIGGMAVATRVMPRYTRDVDLAVAVDSDTAAEAVARFLITSGYEPRMELKQTAINRLATLRLLPPSPPGTDIDPSRLPMLDILFASSGIEREIVADAALIEVVPGLTLPTARIPHLIAMKLLSESEERLQDRIDLKHLLIAATEADLQEVPPLLTLITQRGYARNKDLPAVLERFLRKR